MQADYRVKKLVTEDGGDVIAICYDVLYGETFEKYIGQPDDFDARENASNLLQDSDYEISDKIRAELEEIFGVAEFEDDQDYDGYQFYDFGDEDDEDIYVNIQTKEQYTMSPTNDGRIRLYSLSDDSGRSDITISEDEFYKNYEFVESEEKIDDFVYAGNANGVSTNESFNLREALNQIDLNTYNKYDLLNLYEACDLSENEKRALANIVYDQEDPSVIYDTLNDRFLGKEIEMPERVKDGVIHEDTYSNDEINGRIMEFPNGDYFYVNKTDNTLSLGSATNNGFIPEYEIDYDDDLSLDMNLQNLYDYALESNPHLMYESNENSDYSKLKKNVNESLASRLVDFYKDYDFYDYMDVLEVDETDEDAIKQMNSMLGNNKYTKDLLNRLVEISQEELDSEQKKTIKELIASVKKLLGNSELKEDYEADTMTFAQWFDENQRHDNEKYYPFDNYVKTFENAEVLRNATARDILNNAHIFYDVYPVDSIDREDAFNFASELLGLDYEVFYDAWLSGSPVPGTNLEESKSTRKYNGKSLTEGFYRGCKGVTMIGHGAWSDPELEYNGYLFNYWDIEDALWYDFLEGTGYSDAQSEDPKVEEEFNAYVKERCVDYLDDCIYGGAFTGLSIEGDVVEFSNGDYYYVGYKDGKISLDNVYNAGRAPEYSIDYDFEESIDANLQRLYDHAIEKTPWLNGDDELDESVEDEPYTKEQIEQDLKSITKNFTSKEGELKCGFVEEKNSAVEILKQHYKVVETSGDDRRDGTWYHISFADPIEK